MPISLHDLMVLVRVLGIMLGLFLLWIVFIALVDGLPTSAIGAWLVGELSLLLLGLLLLAPWRYVVRLNFWWVFYALLILAMIGTFAFLAPSVVWASFHNALGTGELILGWTAILICLGQPVAILHFRHKEL